MLNKRIDDDDKKMDKNDSTMTVLKNLGISAAVGFGAYWIVILNCLITSNVAGEKFDLDGLFAVAIGTVSAFIGAFLFLILDSKK